jgi:putative intracellular protease/amidase/ketosteroid isomerase-like protein/tetratricopeptide (TPR) repeat protein
MADICRTVIYGLLTAILLAGSAVAEDATTPHRVTVQEAQGFLRRQEWAKASAAFEQVTKANPNDGQHWHSYAFALHSQGRYDEAIKAWIKSMELGFQPATGLYNLACANSLAGRKNEALSWLQKAIDAGFNLEELIRTDTDLDPIRKESQFKKIIGTPPDGLTREERWRYDLDHLVRRMEKVHYKLYAKVSREAFQQAVQHLKSRVATLKDEELAVGIQQILAMVGDGHTSLMWRPRNDGPLSRYPVEFYLYKEGLYVRSAAAEYSDIAGAKVVKIGNAGTEEALAAVEPLCSRDNAMGVKLESPIFLTNPAALTYLKIADDMTHVALVVEKLGGERVTVDLQPKPTNRRSMKAFVKANRNASAAEPISFKKNDDNFWFEYLPERKLVYFQFNAVLNGRDETLEKFCTRLFEFINANPVENLIIDMRNNGGGNNTLNRPLVHGLIRCDKVNRPGHLFVLAGRRTFSAAMNCSVDIERNTNAIFVGEPTGSSPNFVGETTILQLPCSGLRLSCSSLYWQSSTAIDRRTWIPPELVAEPSIEAFAANRDPGLEAVFAYLEPPARVQTAHAGNDDKKSASKRPSARRNVAIVVYNQMELLDFAGPAEVFAAADSGQAFKVYTVAESAKPIVSQGFVSITPQYTIGNCPRPDILVIPGGNSTAVTRSEPMLSWVKEVSASSEHVLSVCTGVFVLAKAGLLDGHHATTHHSALSRLTHDYPNVSVRKDARVVDNGKIVTAAGVSAGIDGALHVVSKLCSPQVAQRTARYMEYNGRAEEASAEALRKIVDECNRKAIEDFKKGDMLAVARAYADDGALYFGRGQSIHGREAIDRYWQSLKGAKDWKLETTDVGGSLDAIYEVGKSTLVTEADGKESKYVCDYVVVWKRQKDGTYRAHTDIFN